MSPKEVIKYAILMNKYNISYLKLDLLELRCEPKALKTKKNINNTQLPIPEMKLSDPGMPPDDEMLFYSTPHFDEFKEQRELDPGAER